MPLSVIYIMVEMHKQCCVSTGIKQETGKWRFRSAARMLATMMSCLLLGGYAQFGDYQQQHFEGTGHLHLQGWRQQVPVFFRVTLNGTIIQGRLLCFYLMAAQHNWFQEFKKQKLFKKGCLECKFVWANRHNSDSKTCVLLVFYIIHAPCYVSSNQGGIECCGENETGHQMTNKMVRSVHEIARYAKTQVRHSVLISRKL